MNIYNFAFCIDNRFVVPLGVLIYSIQRFFNHGACNFHVLSNDLTDDNIEVLSRLSNDACSIQFYHVNTQEVFDKKISVAFKQRISNSTYFRFLLGEILPHKIDRLLYLDADMICLSSLKGLFETDMYDYVVAVVEDHKIMNLNHASSLGLRQNTYFNAGMLLINMELWRSLNVGEMCISHLTTGKTYEFNDQDILNLVLNQKALFLDKKWNTQTALLEDFGSSEPSLVHFTGAEKPWHLSSCHPFTDIYRGLWQSSPLKAFRPSVYLDECDKGLVRNMESRLRAGNSIVIWGAGHVGRRIHAWLTNVHPDVKILYFVDSKLAYLHTIFDTPVHSGPVALTPDYFIVASHAYAREIRETLMSLGVSDERIISHGHIS